MATSWTPLDAFHGQVHSIGTRTGKLGGRIEL
jgi:hypothetical protein